MPLEDFLEEENLEFADEDIGEFLISVITGGLYIEPHLILREYIQNSHDAITAWQDSTEVGRIDIKIDPPNIHIFDNGPGMSRDELVASMSKVGISSKPFGAASGFMGIGKLAGLSMAERVQIDSSKYGTPEKNRVAFNAGEMLQAIDERRLQGESNPITVTLKEHSRLNVHPMEESVEAHYTAVHLLNINDDYWKAINDREIFLKKLGLVAPVKQDPAFTYAPVIEELLERIAPEQYYPLEIFVNGRSLYRPWGNGVLRPREIEILDGSGNQMAYGWVCQHERSEQISDPLLRGIGLFQRGIAIGERSLAEELGLYGSSPSSLIYFRWYMGELYITDPKILLTANRMSLRRNERVIEFIQRAEQELRKLSNAAAKFSQQDNASKKAPLDIQTIQEVAQKVTTGGLSQEMVPSTIRRLVSARDDLKKRYRYLPEEVKKDATQAVQKGDELLKQFITPPAPEKPSPSPLVKQANLFTVDISDAERENKEDITVSEEEARKVLSISEKLGFSPREQHIFRLIIDAIAEVSGGRDTEKFARYLQKIEEVLITEFRKIQ